VRGERDENLLFWATLVELVSNLIQVVVVVV
jgi:hypothetical protein